MFEIIRIDGLDSGYAGEPLVVALGNFDGVHLAHMQIINAARSLAAKLSASCAVLSFDVHPQIYFAKKPVKLITSEEDRMLLMRKAGVKYAVRARFDLLKDMAPHDFLRLLREKANCVGVACGYNFRFGKGGTGKSSDIKEFFGENAAIEDRFDIGGVTVCSSGIRDMTECGDVRNAALLLGRPFFVSGGVRAGRRIRRRIDFPTANIVIDSDMLAPGKGIYATFTEVDGVVFPSVTNYGTNPTVTDLNELVLETNIIGFDGDIYGKKIRVYFLEKIREQKKFASLDALKEAISNDRSSAERICSEYKGRIDFI